MGAPVDAALNEAGSRTERPLAGLFRRDPHRVVLHRAVRVTLAACLGFYICRFALDDRPMAVYAGFGAIALGALRRSPERRGSGCACSAAPSS